MPQFDPASFASQLFWLAVVFTGLYFVISRIALPRLVSLIDARESQIADNLAKARELQKEAEYLEAMQRKLDLESREKARAMLEGVRAEIAAGIAGQQKQLEAELEAQMVAAETRIANEREQAVQAVRAQLGDLVAGACERLTGTRPASPVLQQAVQRAVAMRAQPPVGVA